MSKALERPRGPTTAHYVVWSFSDLIMIAIAQA